MKTELWNGYSIRFIEKDGEWWAVAVDVAKALAIGNTTMAIKRISDEDKALISIEGISKGNDLVNILSEFGIYDLVFTSHKTEAKDFKRWIYSVLKSLRQSVGLEGFQIFRMLDKEHQKSAMSKLNHTLNHPVRIDFIKANTISNKIISDKHGYPKMIKKSEMTPDMLAERQEVLDSTVELMGIQDKYKLDFSVSDKVREIVNGAEQTA